MKQSIDYLCKGNGKDIDFFIIYNLRYQKRNRTKLKDIMYALNLYFKGLSLRNTSKALSRFVKRIYIAIRDWIQKYKAERFLSGLVSIYGKHLTVSTYGGTWYYPKPVSSQVQNITFILHLRKVYWKNNTIHKDIPFHICS